MEMSFQGWITSHAFTSSWLSGTDLGKCSHQQDRKQGNKNTECLQFDCFTLNLVSDLEAYVFFTKDDFFGSTESKLVFYRAVWKSRWTSWAPVPNKPTVSVDIKQHVNLAFYVQSTCVVIWARCTFCHHVLWMRRNITGDLLQSQFLKCAFITL